MNTQPNPQHGAAVALAQLLQEHPDLPVAGWSIGTETGSLHGHLHMPCGLGELEQYARVLGGSIRPHRDYELQGRMMRPHYLTATWRDVTVSVVVALPAPVSLVRAA